MPLPDSNLPTSSQPWGREVEKRLEALGESVTLNEINNSARDAISQTNITNLLKLMADQVELVTYSTEIPGTQVINFTSPLSELTRNMKQLDINILLNKPRRLLINYSTYYEIYIQTLANGDTTTYGFDFKVYVDGVEVDSQYVLKNNGKTFTNTLTYDNNSINAIKLVPVSAGAHVISVTMTVKGSPPSGGGTMDINIIGDNLIVTVIE